MYIISGKRSNSHRLSRRVLATASLSQVATKVLEFKGARNRQEVKDVGKRKRNQIHSPLLDNR